MTYSGSQPLTLALDDSHGTTLTSVTGPSALPLLRTLESNGNYSLAVSGSAGSSFVLQIAFRPFKPVQSKHTK